MLQKQASKWGADVEIHLHSPLYYNLACETPTINVIGVESAGTPSYLELIDKKVLEEYRFIPEARNCKN